MNMNDKLDLIGRAVAIAKIRDNGCFSGGYHSDTEIEDNVVDMLECLPAIEAVPVVHGRWNGYDTSSYGGMDADGNVKWLPRRFYRCSECRKGSAVKSLYCPSCGTKMDLKDGDCNG